MFNVYFFFNLQMLYCSMFFNLYNPTMIVGLRIISEVLGVYRYIPVCYFLKVILDIGVREPLNMAMYSGITITK